MTSLISIEKAFKAFGALPVLQGVSLSVEKGEVIAIIGPSGSGKSTLLSCIADLEGLDSGKIFFEGKLVRAGDSEVQRPNPMDVKHARIEIGMVFQSFNLFPHMTVLENVMLAPVRVRKVAKKDAKEQALTLLRSVGLESKANERPANLSGGQMQRAAIARALAMRPKLMLFDEVTSALDPELVNEVLSTIKDLASSGMTMILVTHEMNFARDVADRVAFFDQGQLVEIRTSHEMFTDAAHERTRAFLSAYNRQIR